MMCSCNYTYAGPALLVLPLFFISLVNLFVAGPPLKTVVLDASGPKYAASLPYLNLKVDGPKATFHLLPHEEMTHFFVVTCYPARAPAMQLTAQAYGQARGGAGRETLLSEHASIAAGDSAAVGEQARVVQMMQPLLGFDEYEVQLTARSLGCPAGGAGCALGEQVPKEDVALPAAEYRVTYVPTQFSYTQVCVRAFFSVTSACILISYMCAVCAASREPGQWWVMVLLLLLLWLNDPLYIARVMSGGNQLMYTASVLGQILFSGAPSYSSNRAPPAQADLRMCGRATFLIWSVAGTLMFCCAMLCYAMPCPPSIGALQAASSCSGSCTLMACSRRAAGAAWA